MKETQRTKGESPYGSLPTPYVRLSTATTTLQKVNHLRKKTAGEKSRSSSMAGGGVFLDPLPLCLLAPNYTLLRLFSYIFL